MLSGVTIPNPENTPRYPLSPVPVLRAFETDPEGSERSMKNVTPALVSQAVLSLGGLRRWWSLIPYPSPH